MEFFEIVFYILMALVGIGIIYLRLKGILKMPSYYKVLVVVLKKGCNPHKQINKISSLPHTEKIGTKEYEIKKEDLWKIKQSIIKTPIYWLTGIKGNYICIFRESTGKAIESIDAKATPILIRNVRRSKILGKAFNEMFKRQFSGMGRFIIIILITVIIVFYAYQQGWIG